MLCLHAIFQAYRYTFHFQCKLTSRAFLFLAFIALIREIISLYRETGFSHCNWHQTLHLDLRLITINGPDSVSQLTISSWFRKLVPKSITNSPNKAGSVKLRNRLQSPEQADLLPPFFFFFFKTNSHERASAPYRTRVSIQFLDVKRLISRSGNGRFTNNGWESLVDLNWTAPPQSTTHQIHSH